MRIERIRKTVNGADCNWVVDVDITGYFDNIPHDKLMKLVEQRISDRSGAKTNSPMAEAGVMKDGAYEHNTDSGALKAASSRPYLRISI